MKNVKGSVGAVILAAGEGSRMNTEVTKQKINICGLSVLKRCILPFIASDYIGTIVVVCRDDELDFAKSELGDLTKKEIFYTVGGNTRKESAKVGFELIEDKCDFVAIHDAARCLVSEKNINDVCAAAIQYGAATASSPVTDTVKRVEQGFIVETVDRSTLVSVQTPQIFDCKLYRRALEKSAAFQATDDNMLVESIGVKIRLVDTGKGNVKLTTPEDVAYAEFIIGGGRFDG